MNTQNTNAGVSIFYGSQNGNVEMVATEVEETLNASGVAVQQVNGLEDVRPETLKDYGTVLILCSTFGSGDMPDNAADFYAGLMQLPDGCLYGLNYAVLAFGNRSFETFCQAGRKLDDQLENLAANRVKERVDCDIDFDDTVENWVKDIINILKNE